ncbi:hypothetical protein ElyMa_001906000 [Elysia marginata]|uniref:Uncharacterized protein n=1 Tax=Elysia marginata TaxID=1093978 RepID=A0AAV4ESM8_9GAST|nr:hypothetical protein ElyMa_001906000 [Elysia marginata]
MFRNETEFNFGTPKMIKQQTKLKPKRSVRRKNIVFSNSCLQFSKFMDVSKDKHAHSGLGRLKLGHGASPTCCPRFKYSKTGGSSHDRSARNPRNGSAPIDKIWRAREALGERWDWL